MTEGDLVQADRKSGAGLNRRRNRQLGAIAAGRRTAGHGTRLIFLVALAIAVLLALVAPALAARGLFGGRRRPQPAKHQSDGGGQQLVTSTCLDSPAHRHVLGRPDSSTIGTPCVLALLGPAPAGPALGVAGSPPGAVTATAKRMGGSK
jgi:hypothetical protein